VTAGESFIHWLRSKNKSIEFSFETL